MLMKSDKELSRHASRRARDANAYILIIVGLVIVAMILGVLAIAMR